MCEPVQCEVMMQPRVCSREGSLDYDVAAARRASIAFACAPAEYSSRTSSSASAPLGAAYDRVGAQARRMAAETDIALPSLHLQGLGQRTLTGSVPGAVGERSNTGTHEQKSTIFA